MMVFLGGLKLSLAKAKSRYIYWVWSIILHGFHALDLREVNQDYIN